jgi:hypothetical protein
MNKAAYQSVASTINNILKQYDNGSYKPRVSVMDTSNHGKYFDKWSLFVNNDAAWQIQQPGKAQDAFYSDAVYTFTEPNGTDYDMYIEPVDSYYFSLEKL